MALDPLDLRAALGKFATGVTVVTASGPKGPVGITVNSFASVSLDPALVLWSLGKNCNRLDVFEDAEFFAIHVLESSRHDLCYGFTKEAHAFDAVSLSRNPEGVPVFEECVARFECARDQILEGGDHRIFLSKVLRVSTRDADPMVFFDKALGQFGTQTAA